MINSNISTDLVVFTIVVGFIFLYVISRILQSIVMVPAKKEYIVERFGKYSETLNPGLHFLIPFIEKVSFIQDLKD